MDVRIVLADPVGSSLAGGSAGTNVVAALRIAARGEVDGPVVTVLPDAWDRYRATPWMRAWGNLGP